MAKLTARQRHVLELMRNGWELGRVERLRTLLPAYNLQKNGLGRGGEVVRVAHRTFKSLEAAGLIEPGELKYPQRAYVLTAVGRRAIEPSGEGKP